MWKWIALLAFTAFTAVEVAVLLKVGGWLGVGWTLAWMVLTALGGVAVLRLGGMQALVRIHRRLREEELPTLELVDMALVLLAALALIMPGFVADAAGLLLLLPPVRWLVRACVRAWYGELFTAPTVTVRRPPAGEDVIEIRPEE